MKRDFLLEIGCENLPSGYLDDTLDQLKKLLDDGLASERLSCDGSAVMGTPKRLVVFVRGLVSMQETAEETVVGPPVKIGIAPDGGFTKAAEGFAKGQGVAVEALSRATTPKGEYLAVTRRIKGRPAVSILRDRIPAWVQSIRMPKTMRWDSSGMRFGRPIRWILCLYGTDVVRVKIGPLAAGRRTRRSPLFEEAASVKSVDHYFSIMGKNGVILDPAIRRARVLAEARRLALAQGGSLVEDEELVGIVANLLESPVAMAGTYDAAFLALPREVIVTALKAHQRYFSVAGKQGKLLPSFVAFADGGARAARGIVKGYERVLRARLDDAVFYYREDTSKPFDSMAGKLAGIVWLEGLGTLAEKAARIEALALRMHEAWGIGGQGLEPVIRRAARLAKADLASEMVKDGKEFTALQGYIGREYARASGEPDDVAEAIYEHYLPRFAGDDLPKRQASTLVALADKIDTITGCFVMGLEPSGSQDPYALRRHATGIARILMAARAPLSLADVIGESIDLYREPAAKRGLARGALLASLREFYSQRVFSILRAEGIDHDLVAAILGAPWEYPYAALEMAAELGRLRKSGELGPFVLAMKRMANIIPRARREAFDDASGLKALGALAGRRESELGISASLFVEEAERNLAGAVSEACVKLLDARRSGRVETSIGIIRAIVPYVNKFFDEVLVNCEDEKVRDNRIAFLSGSYGAYRLFCDFSLIAGEQA